MKSSETKVTRLAEMVAYQPGSVVSLSVLKGPAGSVTLFAFEESQGLSEHTTPHDALVQILEGVAEISLAGHPHQVSPGESILMPANVPHAVMARTRFKMLLTMLKAPG